MNKSKEITDFVNFIDNLLSLTGSNQSTKEGQVHNFVKEQPKKLT